MDKMILQISQGLTNFSRCNFFLNLELNFLRKLLWRFVSVTQSITFLDTSFMKLRWEILLYLVQFQLYKQINSHMVQKLFK